MASTSERIATKKESRYAILDALRFILAFWVVMGHFGVFPLFAGADTSTRFGHLLVHGWSSLVFGTPAVIGFFVISGFCIHLPFRHDEKMLVGHYYARRYTRILIPLVGAVAAFKLLGNQQPLFTGRHAILWNSILWSLFCEEIYYAVYPAVRLLRRRFGWTPILAVIFTASAFAAAMHLHASDWSEDGPLQTALILFPVWLLGCILAEQVERLPPVTSADGIWKWRFCTWAGSWICEMLHFKAHIYYTITMIPFGVLAYFWIKRELACSATAKPLNWLVAAGTWSYSLYLFHEPAEIIFSKLPIPNFGFSLNWCARTAFMLALSYLFYLAIERPSHRAARRIRVVEK